ncbi:FliH/SctL family protein [Endozoicomonas ascidiicola]|uniref:FliH/SctL family protein n=1 Tax=Endozoicomonas ascidiicola TaxID=1698521 RepID=UPI000831CD2E|nr:FliH/SctL family protein [Endozoicomonas ascidiicola]
MDDKRPSQELMFPVLASRFESELLVPLVDMSMAKVAASSIRPFIELPETSADVAESNEPVELEYDEPKHEDQSLDAIEESPQEPEITEAALLAACDKAYENGFQAGQEALRSEQEAQVEEQKKEHEQGFAQGVEEGRAQALKNHEVELQQQHALLKQVVSQLQIYGETQDHELTDAVVQLVSSITKEMVQAELMLQPEAIQRVVNGAIALLPRTSKQLRIHVNPDDTDKLQDLNLGQEISVEVIADDAQEKGGCRVFCDQSEVDASVGLRMEGYINSVSQFLKADRFPLGRQ